MEIPWSYVKGLLGNKVRRGSFLSSHCSVTLNVLLHRKNFAANEAPKRGIEDNDKNRRHTALCKELDRRYQILATAIWTTQIGSDRLLYAPRCKPVRSSDIVVNKEVRAQQATKMTPITKSIQHIGFNSRVKHGSSVPGYKEVTFLVHQTALASRRTLLN